MYEHRIVGIDTISMRVVAERVIAVVEEILRTGVNYKQNNWVELLPTVEFAINNSASSAHGLTPFYVEEGRHPLLPADVGAMQAQPEKKQKELREHNATQPTRSRSTGGLTGSARLNSAASSDTST